MDIPNNMRRPYRKHRVLIDKKYISVKDWMRNNPQFFVNRVGEPTSEQIGVVLRQQEFERTDSETEVIYRK